jgi:ABC-type sugar transport system ATPase subunit
VTVLRDGTRVLTAPASALDAPQLVSLMAGREAASAPCRRKGMEGQPALEVRGLSRGRAFRDITFEIRRGEVVGLAGLVGAGRTETARAIYGLEPPDAGEVWVQGRLVRITSPDQALARGLAMVTEDRHASGIIPRLSLQQNVTLSSLKACCAGPWVRAGRERAVAGEQMRAFDIRATSPDQPIHQLSGGNQQKALLARALLTRPHILILDEPTRGIDVAAKMEIRALIRRRTGEGLAVLMISSELPEILALSDRVLVMREGRLVANLDACATSAPEILQRAMPA